MNQLSRQELMVLLMVAENRGDDLFTLFTRVLLRRLVEGLIEKQMLACSRPGPVLEGNLLMTERGHAFLYAVSTVPLPQAGWQMQVVTGD